MALNYPANLPATLPTAEGSLEERITVTPPQAYESDYTYEQFPQRIGDVTQHRYWMTWPIGVVSGPANAQSIAPGLTVGTYQRIIAEKMPEVWLVSVSAKAGGGNLWIYDGEPGGLYLPLGLGGFAVFPARLGVLTLLAVGGTASGVVAAIGGFSRISNPSPQISIGSY